jgi:hypothetical protein
MRNKYLPKDALILHRLTAVVSFISSAESPEAPSFALGASEGPPFAFIHGLTAVDFCEGGIKDTTPRGIS